MIDITEGLKSLIALGYQFVHRHDEVGAVVVITGVRVHHGVVDVVQLFGVDDADAVRMPGSEPDILFPRTVLWRSTGPAARVVDELLALGDPVANTTPIRSGQQSGGCWVPVRSGQAKWLPASA